MLNQVFVPCNKDLPLVVLGDHLYGVGRTSLTKNHLLTGYYSVLAEWYDIMAFNHQNIARHNVLGNYDNPTAIAQLMGSDYNLHMGMGFHIGMAWTALFNFLNGFVNTCNDLNTRNHIYSGDRRVGRIESLLKPPSINQVSKLGQQEEGSVESIVQKWRVRDKRAKLRCDVIRNNTSEPSAETLCPFAWVIGKGTTNTVQELNAKMNPVLESTNGWHAFGKPVQNPRTGWYAKKANASFVLRIPVEMAPARTLTIISMKSYGPEWIHSKLKVVATILRKEATTHSTYDPANATYEIEGYHSITTSVHFPHKFNLPGNGASFGDVIILEAVLIEGTMFKINGIALCQF